MAEVKWTPQALDDLEAICSSPRIVYASYKRRSDVPTKIQLAVETVRSPSYRLEDLLSGVTRDSLHEEVATGDPVGREGW